MGYKNLIIVIFMVLMAGSGKAQQADYQTADSISYAKYLSGNWSELIRYGEEVLKGGNDFPLLRLRLAYANFSLGKYSGALRHYNQVFREDSKNEIALNYSYLANIYLHRDQEASYFVARQSKETRTLKPFSLTQIGIEAGLKVPDVDSRGTGTYGRLGVANRLGFQLTLEQSLSLFNQPVYEENNTQLAYYAKLSYVPFKNLVIKGAYHYASSSYYTSVYNSNLLLAGIKYSFPYFSAQADISTGTVNEIQTAQYNIGLTYYPLGNLNIYGFTRLSQLTRDSSDHLIFSQAIGAKMSKKLWLEAQVTAGTLSGYTEADNLYLYNAIDPTEFKSGLSAYILLKDNLTLVINYTYETKSESTQLINYNQHSITSGLTWKF